MNFFRKIIIALTITIIITSPVFSLVIKVGSIAPEGSPWDAALKQIAVEWQTISSGTLNLKIYPGGIVGSEPDMIRKMRIGQLQAAIFTGIGMSYIAPEVLSLSLPFQINSDDELDYILEKTTPHFNTLIEQKGFIVISWAKAGWINFFSKKPVVYPEDLKKQALSVAEGDAEMLQAWREIGFNAIPLSTNDLMTGLQSGMVDAFYAPPLVAAAFQWFALAPNMCSTKIAPMLGGIVISKKVWSQIPDNLKPTLLISANKIIKNLYYETVKLEKLALDTMKKNGLIIHHIPEDALEKWKITTRKGYNIFVGKTFSRDLLLKIKDHLKVYRNKK